MNKCIDCKYFKAYKMTTGGECTYVPSDIEYPNSYGCKKWIKKVKRGRKKMSLIERIIKWITKGKY